MISSLFRRFFYSKWDVLEAMNANNWYTGLELAQKNDWFMGSIHSKLYELVDGGYVKVKRVLYIDVNVARHVTMFKRTGKMREVKTSQQVKGVLTA